MTQQEFLDAVQVLRRTGGPGKGDGPQARLFVAACWIIRNRKVKAGEIRPTEGMSPTPDDIKDFFAKGFTARQWRILKRVAEKSKVKKVPIGESPWRWH